jgi:hypothetical protein
MKEARDDQLALLQEMSQKIDEIEQLTRELKELGKRIPVIEKNTRSILSFTHVLRFGISDLSEVPD